MKTINNASKIVHSRDINKLWESNQLQDYLIVFGNQESGWNFSYDELKLLWSKAIRCSRYKLYGDVYLWYKCNCIRCIHNADEKILNKEVQYKYQRDKDE